LGIAALKIQLNRSLAKLQSAYADFNTANIDTSPFELRISNFKNELRDLANEIIKGDTQFKSDTNEIAKLDGFIQELQDKLIKAQAERVNFIKRVAETKSFLDKSQARVKEVQTEIAELDLRIKNILADKDKLKNIANNLEREVDQIKARISLNERREADLINKITDFKIQISDQQLKLEPSELNNINDMIVLLNGEVRNIRQRIDQLDLQCNGVIDIKVISLTSNDLVYTFNPTQFQSFFNGFYGINAYSNFIQVYKNVAGPLNVYGYNIFSEQWAQSYGKPYETDVQLAYNNGLITDYSFSSDFQCSNYQSLINGSGKINNISGNLVLVADKDGKIYELQLGACSRINGVNQQMPKVGNSIEWRGVKNYDTKYFIHTATCY
jgi:predicted nuclease with TOPRIM domain